MEQDGTEGFLINPSTMPPASSFTRTRHIDSGGSAIATGTANNSGAVEDENISYSSNLNSAAPSSVYESVRARKKIGDIDDNEDVDEVESEWDSELGIEDLEDTPKTIRCIAFSPCGQFVASGGDDRKVTVYSLLTKQKLHKCQINGGVLTMSYSPNNGDFLWVGGDDECITVIDTSTFMVVKTIEMNGDVESIVHSPSSRNHVAAGGSNHVITILDANTYEIVKEIEQNGAVSDLAYSMDGKLLSSGGLKSKLVVYNTIEYNVSKTFEELKSQEQMSCGYVTSIKYAPNEKFFVAAHSTLPNREGDKMLTMYKLPFYSVVKEYKRKMEVNAIAFSPDSKLLAVVGDERKISILDTSTFEVVKELDVKSSNLAVAFSSNNVLAYGGYDEKVTLYNTSTFEVIVQFHGDTVIGDTVIGDNRNMTIEQTTPTPPDAAASGRSLIITREEDDTKLDEINDILIDIEKNEPVEAEKKGFSLRMKDLERKEFRKECFVLLGAAGILLLMMFGLIGIIILVR